MTKQNINSPFPAYSPDSRSAWTVPVTVETPTGDHQRRGSVLARSSGRIGGASMMTRGDGSILLYAGYQDKVQDQGRFEIHGMTSSDNGEHWSKLHPILAAEDRTFMAAALLRLRSGVALFCYTQRDLTLTRGMRYCKRSTDGGMTWSEPIPITTNLPLHSHGIEFDVPSGPHDRVIQTSSGRVIFPIHFPRVHPNRIIASAIYYSDDEGKTWTFATGPIMMMGKTGARIKKRDLQGFWEPAIVVTAPGELLMYMRSNSGWYYEIRSHDDGTNWSAPTQSNFRAPLAPAKLVKLPNEKIGIVYNGIMDYNDQNLSVRWDLATMISDDAGSTWENSRLLEFSDPHVRQERRQLLNCYPSLLWNDGILHLTYYGVVDGQHLNMLYQQLPPDWFTRYSSQDSTNENVEGINKPDASDGL